MFDFYGDLIPINGVWWPVNMEIEYKENEGDPYLSKTNVTQTVFLASGNSVTANMSYLGISPGPKSLKNYMFFYQFNPIHAK